MAKHSAKCNSHAHLSELMSQVTEMKGPESTHIMLWLQSQKASSQNDRLLAMVIKACRDLGQGCITPISTSSCRHAPKPHSGTRCEVPGGSAKEQSTQGPGPDLLRHNHVPGQSMQGLGPELHCTHVHVKLHAHMRCNYNHTLGVDATKVHRKCNAGAAFRPNLSLGKLVRNTHD
eukprot:1161821-Pelagomonas_calceolata.AAC.4